jgi:AcrR family transcriptional regulator
MLPGVMIHFPKTDGRNARAGRTRAAVAEAMLKLIRDGHLKPTAAQVAEEARVSLRSVFQHFEDMESLYAAVAEAQMARFEHMLSEDSSGGPLPRRLQAFVDRRAKLLEMVTPVRRAAILQEPFSDVLAARLRWAHDMARGELERTFAPELDSALPVVRAELLAALDLVTNWPAWDTLRRMNGLSIPESKRVMERAIGSLLNGQRYPRGRRAGSVDKANA